MSEPRPAAPPEQPLRRRGLRRYSLRSVLLLLIGGLGFLYILPSLVFTVPAGYAAVIWHRFGGGTDVRRVRSEGTRLKLPWDLATFYDVRLQAKSATFGVLTADGLRSEVVVTVRYRLYKDTLGELHKNVGPRYLETLLLPEMGAHVREELARYAEHDLYSLRREEIQARILDKMRRNSSFRYQFDGRGAPRPALFIEDVLVRDIRLPPEVARAIQAKLVEEQRLLQFDYRLQEEQKEARRKEIEAQGIRRFQEVVDGSISDRYLKWKGIDATLELARSNNAKVVVIGSGNGGLPIILGGINEPASPEPAPVATAPRPPPAPAAPRPAPALSARPPAAGPPPGR